MYIANIHKKAQDRFISVSFLMDVDGYATLYQTNIFTYLLYTWDTDFKLNEPFLTHDHHSQQCIRSLLNLKF